MKKRPTKVDRMTPEEKLMHSKQFWSAPNDADFPPETIAIVMGMSLSWLQNKRSSGGGIPFTKPCGNKIIYYKKSDVLDYISKNKLAHTA